MTPFRRDGFADLWNEFARVQEEFGRLLSSPSLSTSLPLNVWHDDHNLYVETDLPDIDPSQLDVSIAEGNQLTVQGERKAPEVSGAVWVRQERPYGRFTRSVTLPVLVDADNVEANYEDGVLKLKLPRLNRSCDFSAQTLDDNKENHHGRIKLANSEPQQWQSRDHRNTHTDGVATN